MPCASNAPPPSLLLHKILKKGIPIAPPKTLINVIHVMINQAAVGRNPRDLAYVPLHVHSTKFDALVDTGASVNALPLWQFNKIKKHHPSAVTELPELRERYVVTIANDDKIQPASVAKIKFSIAGKMYDELFLVLRRMNTAIISYTFMADHDIWIKPQGNYLRTPELTFQLNCLAVEGKKKRVKTTKGIPVETLKTVTIPPNRYETVECGIPESAGNFGDTAGVVVEYNPFARSTRSIAVTSALCSMNKNGHTGIGLVNVGPQPVTIPAHTRIATLELLTPDQAQYLAPIDPSVAERAAGLPDEYFSKEEFNQLICSKTTEEESKHWFPTPENCKDPSTLSGPMLRIYNELVKFKEAEKLDPNKSAEMRAEYLGKFNWEGTILNAQERARLEELLVEYNDIFSRHRWDIGGNSEIKVKLTPEHDEPVFKRSPPCPIHYKDDLMVELALMQYHGIITTLSSSKYSSPIFCQRKSNGKLRILIDLRRINHLIRHDYDQNNFPIANMTDASAHLAGKKMFTKFDCRQAYFAIHIDDMRSVQLLSFNFASRTFAFQRLAQGLSRSVSAFSAVMIHYLQGNIANDECHTFVDDVIAGSKDFESHLIALRNVFTSIRKCGIRFGIDKCEFGVTKVQYLGSTVTTEGIQPNDKKIEEFLKTVKLPTTLRKVYQFTGFVNWFRNYIPNMAQKMLPFYRLQKSKEKKIILDASHSEALEILKKDLVNACRMTLRIPMAGKQFILLTDASFDAAGFVLMIEDYTIAGNDQKTKKRYAPVAFGSKVFHGSHRKASIFAKEFLAVHFAFEAFAHILWGAREKPIIVLTDNSGLSSFFQAKSIPPSLWNYMDHVLSFRWVIGHIPGKANPAADYLSRMHEDPNAPLHLSVQGHVPAYDICIDMDSDKPQVEELESIAEQRQKTINQLLLWEDDTRVLNEPDDHQIQDEPQADVQSPNEEAEITYHVAFHINVTYKTKASPMETEMLNVLAEPNPIDKYDFENKRNVLDMIAEQGRDPEIMQIKQWIVNQQIPDTRYASTNIRKYLRQISRLTIRDNLLKRRYHDHTGKVTHHQICIPSHLVPELLVRLHNTATQGHPGMRQTIEECRRAFYFPGYQEIIEDYVRNCVSCLQVKRTADKNITPPLQPITATTSFPGDILEIDLVGKFDKTAGPTPYCHILTGIDVFSQYLFAIPMKRVSAIEVAKTLVQLFLQHAYIPRKILTDKGTAFGGRLIKELAKLLNIEIEHATTKHARTIGALERRHAGLKKTLKIFEGPQKRNWHEFVSYAMYTHNTSYNAKTRCTPADLFHGHSPDRAVDLRFNAIAVRRRDVKFGLTREVQDSLLKIYASQQEDILSRYYKYKESFDKKSSAQPLMIHSYCLLLNPLFDNQQQHMNKMKCKWIPTFRVEQRFNNENYLVRRVNTNYTQLVHRIRLRPFTPQFEIVDLPQISASNFCVDPEVPEHLMEPGLLDRVREQMAKENEELRLCPDSAFAPHPSPIAPPAAVTRTSIQGPAPSGPAPSGSAVPHNTSRPSPVVSLCPRNCPTPSSAFAPVCPTPRPRADPVRTMPPIPEDGLWEPGEGQGGNVAKGWTPPPSPIDPRTGPALPTTGRLVRKVEKPPPPPKPTAPAPQRVASAGPPEPSPPLTRARAKEKTSIPAPTHGYNTRSSLARGAPIPTAKPRKVPRQLIKRPSVPKTRGGETHAPEVVPELPRAAPLMPHCVAITPPRVSATALPRLQDSLMPTPPPPLPLATTATTPRLMGERPARRTPEITPPQDPSTPTRPKAPVKAPLCVSPAAGTPPVKRTTRHTMGSHQRYPSADPPPARRLTFQSPTSRGSTSHPARPRSLPPPHRITPLPSTPTKTPISDTTQKPTGSPGALGTTGTPGTPGCSESAARREQGPTTAPSEVPHARGARKLTKLRDIKPQSYRLSRVLNQRTSTPNKAKAPTPLPAMTQMPKCRVLLPRLSPSKVLAASRQSSTTLPPATLATAARGLRALASLPNPTASPRISRSGRVIKTPSKLSHLNQLEKARLPTRQRKEVLVFRDGPIPVAAPGENPLAPAGEVALPGDDVVVRFATLEKIEKIVSKNSSRKAHGGTPELGCIRKIYDKNSHRHTLNLVVAARDHPFTVQTLELALFNLQSAISDTAKRIHVPLDMRILKSLDKMSVILAFEEVFWPTELIVHIWNFKP